MVNKDYLYISGIKHDSIVDGDGFRNIIFIKAEFPNKVKMLSFRDAYLEKPETKKIKCI